MVIKATAATEIRALVAALSGDDEVPREAAIARLGIIGGRAVDRLTDEYSRVTTRSTRLAILRALEVIGDHRSALLARQALDEGGDLAVAATGVFRALLSSPNSTVAAGALDTIVATTLDARHDRRLRLTAFDALQDMAPAVRSRVAEALQADPAMAISPGADVLTGADREAAGSEAVWSDALDGRLPDAPELLRQALATKGAAAPLNALRALVDAVRVREHRGVEPGEATVREWVALRGALHQALGLRGSRVALYDLREAVQEAKTPLPTSFLTALHVLGDVSCLEPIAAAWAAADGDRTPEGLRWRHQLATALRAIAQRKKITRRHASMKRIAARWRGVLE
jgi:hypothetical protein